MAEDYGELFDWFGQIVSTQLNLYRDLSWSFPCRRPERLVLRFAAFRNIWGVVIRIIDREWRNDAQRG